MAKNNDIFLDIIVNPEHSVGEFQLAGRTPENTQLRSADIYKNNEKVREVFTQNGKFREDLFDATYKQASAYYNALADESHKKDFLNTFSFDSSNIYAKPEEKTRDEAPKFFRMSNPERRTWSMTEFGVEGERTMSIDEIALTQRVLLNPIEYEKGADPIWGDSPNDSFWDQLFGTQVLAVWDSDGTHKDPLTGEIVRHQKGENKINENGTYFYEDLAGRSVYGRQVLNKMNILTTDGSFANKLDFIDSDGLTEKSAVGTALRGIALCGSMFIPYVGKYIAGASVLTQTVGLGATMVKMIDGLVDDDYISGVNEIEAYVKSWNRQNLKSEYASQNTWCWENYLGLAADVAGQLAEQRVVFKELPRFIKGKKGAFTEKERQAALSEIAEELEKNKSKNWGEAMESLRQKSITPVEFESNLLKQTMANGAANLAEAQLIFDNFMKEYTKLGEKIAQGYMTAITVGDTYGEAKEAGAEGWEAAMLTLGYAAAEWKLLNSDIGKWIMPEARSENYRFKLLAEQINPIRHKIEESASKIAAKKGGEKLEKEFFLKEWFKAGSNLCKNFYGTVSENMNIGKAGAASLISHGLGEGVEEVSEELLADFSKTIYNLIDQVFYSGEHKMSAWDNMLDRYAMSFLGGAAGGAGAHVFTELPDLTKDLRQARDIMRDPTSDAAIKARKSVIEQFVYMQRQGTLDDFEKWLNKNDIGDKNLSDQIDSDTGYFKPAENGMKSLNQLAKEAIYKQLKLIKELCSVQGGALSDDSVIKNNIDVLKEMRISAITNSSQTGLFLQEYNSTWADYVKLSMEIKNLEGNPSDSEEKVAEKKNKENKELLDKRQELLRLELKLNSYKEGKLAPAYYQAALFDMSDQLSGLWNVPKRNLYIQIQAGGKRWNEISDEDKKKFGEKYDKLESSNERRNKVKDAAELYVLLSQLVAPLITQHQEQYKQLKQQNSAVLKGLTNLLSSMKIDNFELDLALAKNNPELFIEKIQQMVRDEATIFAQNMGLEFMSEEEKRLFGSDNDINRKAISEGRVKTLTNDVGEVEKLFDEEGNLQADLSELELIELEEQRMNVLWKLFNADGIITRQILKLPVNPEMKFQLLQLIETIGAVRKELVKRKITELEITPVINERVQVANDILTHYNEIRETATDEQLDEEILKPLQDAGLITSVKQVVNDGISGYENYTVEDFKQVLVSGNLGEIIQHAINSEKEELRNTLFADEDFEGATTDYKDQIDVINDLLKQATNSIEAETKAAMDFYNQNLDDNKTEGDVNIDQVIAFADKFVITGLDGVQKISKVVQEMEQLFSENRNDVTKILKEQEVLQGISEARNVIRLLKSVFYGAKTDTVDVDNLFGYNKTINEVNHRVGNTDWIDLGEIDAETADTMIQGIELLDSRLQWAEQLISVNRGQKLNVSTKVGINSAYITYNKLRNYLSIGDDDDESILAGKLGINSDLVKLFKDSLNKLSLLKSGYSLDITKRQLNLTPEQQVQLEKERLLMDKAVYDFFNGALKQGLTVEKLSGLFSDLRFDLFHDNGKMFTADSIDYDDRAFVWYLASRSALDSYSFIKKFKEKIDKTKAPIPPQVDAALMMVSLLANKGIFKMFKDALTLGVLTYIKNNLDTKEKKEAFLKSHNDLDNYDEFLSQDKIKMWNYLPIFNNTVLVEGGAGVGKSKGVAHLFLQIVREIDPTLLENVWIAHMNEKNAKDGFKDCQALDQTKVKYMSHTDLINITNPSKPRKTFDENGVMDESDYFTIENGEVHCNVESSNDHEVPTLVIIDEVFLLSLLEMDRIDKDASKYGYSVLVLGDNSQNTTNSKVNDGKESTNLHRNHFFGTSKLGISLRTNNRQVDINNSQLDLFCQDYNNLLKNTKGPTFDFNFHSYLNRSTGEDGNTKTQLFGTVVLPLSYPDGSYDEFSTQSVIIEPTGMDRGIQGLSPYDFIKELINDLDDPDDKIGIIFARQDSALHSAIMLHCGSEILDRLDIHFGSDAQGLEGKYYIIDTERNESDDDETYLKRFYTGNTRALQGVILMGPDKVRISDKQLVFKSEIDSDTIKMPITDDEKKKYGERRKQIYDLATKQLEEEYKFTEVPIIFSKSSYKATPNALLDVIIKNLQVGDEVCDLTGKLWKINKIDFDSDPKKYIFISDTDSLEITSEEELKAKFDWNTYKRNSQFSDGTWGDGKNDSQKNINSLMISRKRDSVVEDSKGNSRWNFTLYTNAVDRPGVNYNPDTNRIELWIEDEKNSRIDNLNGLLYFDPNKDGEARISDYYPGLQKEWETVVKDPRFGFSDDQASLYRYLKGKIEQIQRALYTYSDVNKLNARICEILACDPDGFKIEFAVKSYPNSKNSDGEIDDHVEGTVFDRADSQETYEHDYTNPSSDAERLKVTATKEVIAVIQFKRPKLDNGVQRVKDGEPVFEIRNNLEVPIALLASPLTIIQDQVFSAIGLSEKYREINEELRGDHFAVLLKLIETIKTDEKFKQYYDNVKEYGFVKDFVTAAEFWCKTARGYFPMKIKTLGELESHGPEFMKQTNRDTKEDLEFNGRYCSINEFKENSKFYISSRVMTLCDTSGTKILVGVNEEGEPVYLIPGKSFILVACNDELRTDQALVDAFTSDDPKEREKVKLIYVLPPTASLQEYCEYLDDVIKNSKPNDAIGLKATSVTILNDIFRNCSSEEDFIKWVMRTITATDKVDYSRTMLYQRLKAVAEFLAKTKWETLTTEEKKHLINTETSKVKVLHFDEDGASTSEKVFNVYLLAQYILRDLAFGTDSRGHTNSKLDPDRVKEVLIKSMVTDESGKELTDHFEIYYNPPRDNAIGLIGPFHAIQSNNYQWKGQDYTMNGKIDPPAFSGAAVMSEIEEFNKHISANPKRGLKGQPAYILDEQGKKWTGKYIYGNPISEAPTKDPSVEITFESQFTKVLNSSGLNDKKLEEIGISKAEIEDLVNRKHNSNKDYTQREIKEAIVQLVNQKPGFYARIHGHSNLTVYKFPEKFKTFHIAEVAETDDKYKAVNKDNNLPANSKLFIITNPDESEFYLGLLESKNNSTKLQFKSNGKSNPLHKSESEEPKVKITEEDFAKIVINKIDDISDFNKQIILDAFKVNSESELKSTDPKILIENLRQSCEGEIFGMSNRDQIKGLFKIEFVEDALIEEKFDSIIDLIEPENSEESKDEIESCSEIITLKQF